MWLNKDDCKVYFDIVANIPKGSFYYTHFNKIIQERYLAGTDMYKANTPKTPIVNKVSVTFAHKILGHMGEARTRNWSKHLVYDLTIGSIPPCETCAMGKSKQKNMTKESDQFLETRSS